MGKRKEDNVTWRHIEQKKREIARLRRRRFLRRLLAMVIFTVLLLLAAGGIYALVRGTEYLICTHAGTICMRPAAFRGKNDER